MSEPPEDGAHAPDEKPPGKRAEKRRRDIRAIVDAARALADQGGIDAVRLRDVSQRSAVSMGALYRCFVSKEDILLYAFAEDFSILEHAVASRPFSAGGPLERIEGFFRLATRGVVARPSYGRAVIAATASGQEAVVRQMATLHARMSRLILTVLTGDGSDLPKGTSDEAMGIAAQALNRVWFSALVAWSGGLVPIEDVIVDMRNTTSVLLTGVVR
jgi:AcrR family transcriptional regulator